MSIAKMLTKMHIVTKLRKSPCIKRLLPNPPALAVMQRGVASEAKFDTQDYQLHKLDTGPSTTVSVTRDDAIKMYQQMQTIRRIETSAADLYRSKTIRGFCHLCSGQEACCVGMEAGITADDPVISAYRIHGWSYCRGMTAKEILCELTGRQSGCAKGRGGSMHMYNERFYGGNGIVGAQIPVGAGIALALQYQNKANVCLALYGDGAANQGQLFESFNMAKLWNLPIVFVCENNGYGMGTSISRSSASTAYYARGDFVPGLRVDGMDVLAVREATRFAKEYALQNGPVVLEAATYRYFGHSMSDPGTSYRPRSEIDDMRSTSDPIKTFSEKIIAKDLVTEDEIKAFDKEIKKEVQDAVSLSKSDEEIPLAEMFKQITVNAAPGDVVRGCDLFTIGAAV